MRWGCSPEYLEVVSLKLTDGITVGGILEPVNDHTSAGKLGAIWLTAVAPKPPTGLWHALHGAEISILITACLRVVPPELYTRS